MELYEYCNAILADSEGGGAVTTLVAVTLIAQAQAQPTPEVLNALTGLMKAISAAPAQPSDASSWHTPEGLKAIAAFISAIAWPAIALFAIVHYRREIANFLTRVKEVDLFGLKAKIETELNKSAQDAAALPGLSNAPTQGELRRAEEVAQFATDPNVVRQQVDELATEYETVRAAHRRGNDRTRRMEVVVAKMRTIGRAAFRLRYELSQSPSPGRRLQAIACLQVVPDLDMLDWLAERVRVEKPFVGYHAVVALNVAAEDEKAHAHIEALQHALQLARTNAHGLREDTDRATQLAAFERRVAALTPQT